MSSDRTFDGEVIAVFDFDDTLIRGDSVVPFLRSFTGVTGLGLGLLRHPVRLLRAITGRNRSALRELATEVVFAGRRADEVELRGRDHARSLTTSRLRDDTTARLSWHRDEGHRVVIVSASYEAYLRHVADHLRADDVLSTRLEVIDGVCTGRLTGPNCRGAEKVRRLEAWMTATGRRRHECSVWAYGDSSGDREMLDWADHGVWVQEPLASVSAIP